MDPLSINWQNNENYLFYNQRLNAIEQENIRNAYEVFTQNLALEASLFFPSSGTSGQKKIYALSKQAILISAQACIAFANMQKKTTALCPLPSHHMGAMAIYARAHLLEQKVLQMNRWDTDEFMQNANEADYISLVPTQIYDLVKQNLTAPKRIKHILVGGSYLSPELYAQARALHWPIYPSFGSTELASQIATAKTLNSTNYSLELLPHMAIQVTQDQRLHIKSKSLFTAYIDIKTSEIHRASVNLDGFYISDDYVQMQGKTLIPLGRKKDYIKINAEAVSLKSIEQRLSPFLKSEHCVVARKEQRAGYVVCLILAANESTMKHVLAYNKQASPLEKIKEVYLVAKLPRNEMGKILENKIVEEIESGSLKRNLNFNI